MPRFLTRLPVVLALALVGLVSACAETEGVSRSGVTTTSTAGTARQAVLPPLNVVRVKVTVPQKLTVSEANLFYPVADIVWRGEARGNRHAQVQRIFTESLDAATARMNSGRAVAVEAQVVRFHSVTEKTRYTVGGVHSLRYLLVVRDAKTGAVIDGPRAISADVPAAGGQKAFEEDQRGRTQRVVIVEALTRSFRQALAPRAAVPVSRATVAPATGAVLP